MTQRLDYQHVARDGTQALLGVHTYLTKCGLEEELLELVYLRVSSINGCAFCIDLHTNALLKMGVKPEKMTLTAAWRECERLFSERERAALRWAEVVTRVEQTQIPDDEFAAVRPHFDDKELADLTIAVGIINTFNRLSIAFRRTPASLVVRAK